MKGDNPFGDFDLTKMLGDMKMPAFDGGGLMEAQKRNFEAIQQANQAAVTHMQAIVKRQAEMMQDAMNEASKAMKDMMSAGTPEEGARRQSEMVQRALEQAVANVREIAEMTAKSNRDIFDLVNSRMVSGVEEMRDIGAKAAAAAKPPKAKKE